MLASAAWPALGTTATVVVTPPGAIAGARRLLEDELARIDDACSRFRDDSELSRANARAGEPFAASRLFAEAVQAALRVAEATGGAVDPTVGRPMRNIGYDRDFARLDADMPAPPGIRGGPRWQSVRLDRRSGLLFMPLGMELDLGATAKALAADRAARRIEAELACGILVNLGGDISVAGPPPSGGWRIAVSDDHADAGSGPCQTVSIPAGGLATSSTTVRRWSAGGRALHHIVDPRTGTSAPVVWRTVSVAAGSCVDANAASTASIVRGSSAPDWLARFSLPSRLVAANGDVVRVAGWPREER